MPISQLLFSLSGRLNRKPYWLATLALMVSFIALLLVVALMTGRVAAWSDGGEGGESFFTIRLILMIPAFWFSMAVAVKRLHDRNKSAWWVLLFAVLPGVLEVVAEGVGTAGIILMVASLALSIWGLVEMGFLRGTVGPNQYGPDPLQRRVDPCGAATAPARP